MQGVGAGTRYHEGAAIPKYRRITIQKYEDLPLIYQLLESYIEHPELALSVKEIVFLPSARSSSRFRRPPTEEDNKFEAEEVKRDISEEQFLYRGVKLLDLSAEHEEKWVRILSWMKPEVVDLRRSLVENSHWGTYFFDLNRQQGHGFMYYATALLLMLCPNIERLVYRDNMPINPVEEILKRINYDLLPNKYLQNLKDVVLVGTNDVIMGDERFYISTDVLNLLSMFHRLPSIETISAETMDSPRTDFVDTFPPGTSNIRKINITHSSFGSDIVAALVRTPKALEDLTITTGGRASSDMSSALMFAKEVGKALGCQKHSLRRLDLDLGYSNDAAVYKYPEDPWPVNENATPIVTWEEYHRSEHRRALISRQTMIDEAEAQGPLRAMKLPEDRPYGACGETIGSLHDYEKLTHLSINLQHLRGGSSMAWRPTGPPDPPFKLIDAMPPNLEYLLIRGYTKGQQPDLDEEFAEILRVKSTKFPKLQQIYGIDETVPAGETVSHPDRDRELLYEAEAVDYGWLEHTHDEL